MERASREVWAKRVERWKDSGLTAKEFAAELDVSPNSLTFWKWKLGKLANVEATPPRVSRKQGAAKRAKAAKFVELVPTATPHGPGAPFELVFSGGMVLRVARDFDEAALSRLVGVLRGR